MNKILNIITIESVDEILKYDHSFYFILFFLSMTIQMKANEQHFPMVLLIMLYKQVQTFESVDEILNCIVYAFKLIYDQAF